MRSIGSVAVQSVESPNPVATLDFTLPRGTWTLWAMIRSPIISSVATMSNIIATLEVEAVATDGSSSAVEY